MGQLRRETQHSPKISSDYTEARISVFDRLGPRHQIPNAHYGDGEDQGCGRPALVNPNKSRPPRSGPCSKNGSAPRLRRQNRNQRENGNTMQPGANIVRQILQEVRGDGQHDGRQAAGPSTGNAQKGAGSRSSEVDALKKQLERAEADRQAAQELADAVLQSQQALLVEKNRVAQKNAALATEAARLMERLALLESMHHQRCEDEYGAATTTTPKLPLPQSIIAIDEDEIVAMPTSQRLQFR